MNDDRRQPTVAIGIALVILLPVLYFLSLRPLVLVWTLTEPTTPPWLETAFDFYVAPAGFAYDHSPEPIRSVMDGYVGFFTDES